MNDNKPIHPYSPEAMTSFINDSLDLIVEATEYFETLSMDAESYQFDCMSAFNDMNESLNEIRDLLRKNILELKKLSLVCDHTSVGDHTPS